MIYFFLKSGVYLQCEIYPGRPHVLTYVDATGTPQTERFHKGDDLDARWQSLQHELNADGWTGPLGRDARS